MLTYAYKQHFIAVIQHQKAVTLKNFKKRIMYINDDLSKTISII